MTDPAIIRLFEQMAEHTAPECASSCRVPHSCCEQEYCRMTEDYAKSKGVILEHTDHRTLLFMGPNGCTVAPYLRPLCTVHTCAINSLGFKPGDPVWTARYFELRNAIDDAMWEDFINGVGTG